MAMLEPGPYLYFDVNAGERGTDPQRVDVHQVAAGVLGATFLDGDEEDRGHWIPVDQMRGRFEPDPQRSR